MNRARIGAGWFALALLASSGCDDLLPANPFDPRAPLAEQARGSIRGTLFLDDPAASPTILHAELQALTVRLLDGAGQQLRTASCVAEATAEARMTCDDALRTASFEFGEVVAGAYQLVVDGVNPRYIPVDIAPLELVPGEIEQLGTLRYVVLAIDTPSLAWTGRVEVETVLAAGSGGARRVSLYRHGSSGLELLTAALTDSAGRAIFEQVPPGIYAVAAELELYTPDYRAGFEIQGETVPVERNTQLFTGTAGLRLYPVAAVLIPALQQTFGQYYTNGSTAPVQVLQFGGMNEMRLATDSAFSGADAGWLEYTASTSVDLPDVEGAIDVFAQFRNTQDDRFTFESSVYKTQVVRDVTPPEVLAVRVRGRTAGDDGKIWLTADASVLSIEVDGQDAVSAVYSIALHHDAGNGAGDPQALSYTLTESPAGLVRLEQAIGLTAGAGEKKIFVYLRDRAGNTSAAGAVSVWVDTTPPTVSLIMPGPLTGSPLVAVQVLADDANGVASMQVWEEGQAVPAPVPLASVASVQLQPLSYANTTRQINALVSDVAGNLSSLYSDTIEFDDRGALSGLLQIEDAVDGSAGTAAGVSALLDGQGYAVQFAATGNRGEYRFTIDQVPASNNRQLVLQKAGYSEARSVGHFAVVPGVTSPVGTLVLRLARGTIRGVAQLDSGANHAGIVVALQGTALSTTTAPDGAFSLVDVPAATGYTVVFRYDDDHSTEERSGVQVLAGQTTQLSSAAAPIILVTLQGGVAIAEGNYTNNLLVHLVLFFEGALEFRVSEDDTFAGAPYRAFGDGATGCVAQAGGAWRCPFTLADSDRLHRIHVQFRDPAAGGFESDVRSDSITLDRVKPSAGSVVLANGAAAVRALNVEAELQSSDDNGVALMQLSTDGASYASPESFHSPSVQTFVGAEGSKCLYARFIDVAGNISDLPAAFDCVDYDITAPSGSIAIVDSAGNPFPGNRTRSAAVYLRVTSSDAVQMMLSNSSDFPGVTWRPYDGTLIPWNLDGGDGQRWVYLALQDAARNEASGTVSLEASIYVDGTPPLAPIFSVLEGAYASSPLVHLDYTNRQQGSETLTVLFQSNRDLNSTQVDSSGNDPATYTLPAVDGLHILSVRYRDLAGNESLAANASITLDRVFPQVVSFAVDGNGATRLGTVTLSIEATGASEMRFSNSPTFVSNWETYQMRRLAWPIDTASQGTKSIYLQVRDQAGNVTTAASPATVVYDTQLPTGSLAVSGTDKDGPSSVNTRLPRITVTTSGFAPGANGSALLQYKMAEDSNFPGVVWQDCPLLSDCNFSRSWDLSAGDGSKTVYVSVKDAAGNASTAIFNPVAIRLDTTPPALTALLEGPVAGAARSNTYSNSLTVDIKPTASDVGGSGLTPATGLMQVSTAADFSGASWEALTPTRSHTFSAGDGVRRIYVKVRDRAGNERTTDASIIVDTARPSLGSVSFTAGEITQSTAVILDIVADGAAEMRLTGNLDPAPSGAWVPFSPTSNLTLASGNGDRTVTVELRDAAGNSSDPAYRDATIRLDSTPPTVGTIAVRGTGRSGPSASYTRTASVTVTIAGCGDGTDGSGVTEMMISETNLFTGAAWQPCAPDSSCNAVFSYTLSSGDTSKTLYLKVRDDSLRESGPTPSNSITLDTTPPSDLRVTITGTVAGGFTSTSLTGSQTVNLTLAATDANGAARMWVANDPSFVGAIEEGWSGSKNGWSLSAGSGERRVYLRVVDEAGNLATGNGSIVLDTTAPEITSVLVNNGVPVSASDTAPVQISAIDALSGVYQMYYSRNGLFNDGSWVPYNTSTNWDFNGAAANVSETRTSKLKVRDNAGRESSPVNLTLGLDYDRPSLLPITLDDVAVTPTYATVPIVHVYSTASDVAPGTVTMMQVSEDANFVGAAWEPYLNPTTLVLSPLDGRKSVHMRVKDSVNRVSDPRSASIVLDTEPPVIASYRPTNPATGYGYWNNYTGEDVDVVISLVVEDATSASGSTWHAVRNLVPDCATVTYDHTPALTCSGTVCTADELWDARYDNENATHVAYACARDGAGNTTAVPASATFYYDYDYATAPVIVSVTPSANSIALDWNPSTNVAPSGVGGYHVWLGTGYHSCYPSDPDVVNVFTVPPDQTSYTITGLEPLQTYFVGVTAFAGSGKESNTCSERQVTTGWRQRLLSTPLADRGFGPAAMARSNGYVYLGGRISAGAASKLRIWRCPYDAQDCGSIENWGPIYPYPWEKFFDDMILGNTILGDGIALATGPDRLYSGFLYNAAGTNSVGVVWCSTASTPCTAPSSLLLETSASILTSGLDVASNATHVFVTYQKSFGATDYRTIVRGCPHKANCALAGNWTNVELPQGADWTGATRYGLDANDRYVMAAFHDSYRDMQISICDMSTGCDAPGDWSGGIAPPSNSEPGGSCYDADVEIGRQYAFVAFRCSDSFAGSTRRLASCPLSSGCLAPGNWSTNLNGGSGAGSAGQLQVVDGDLYLGYWLSGTGSVMVSRCVDGDSAGCGSATMRSVAVGSPVSATVLPTIGSFGPNPAVVWLDDDERVRMASPAVPAARLIGAFPGLARVGYSVAPRINLSWAPLQIAGGYQAMWGALAGSLDDNTVLLTDPLQGTVNLTAVAGTTYQVSLQTISVSDELSLIPAPHRARPFADGPGNASWVPTYFIPGAQCDGAGASYCADYAVGNADKRMLVAYNYDSYFPEPCIGYGCPQLYQCDTGTTNCTGEQDWKRTVLTPTLNYPFAVDGDANHIYVGVTNIYYSNPQQVGVLTCDLASGCDDATEFRERSVVSIAVADGADPAMAVGAGRVWLLTRSATGTLLLHHCSTGTDCSVDGNWVKNVAISAGAETSDNGHAIAAGGTAVGILRPTAAGLKYIHCGLGAACNGSEDFTELVLTADAATKHMARLDLGDDGAPTAVALIDSTKQVRVFSCPVASATCVGGTQWWVDRALTTTSGVALLDLRVAAGRRYVLYGDSTMQIMAHCQERCYDLEQWASYPVTTQATDWSLPRRNNRSLFVADDASALGLTVGERYFQSGNYTRLITYGNGLLKP